MFTNSLVQIIGSIILAAVPALIWGGLFYHKHPKERTLLGITFIMGAIAVLPILFYKFLWNYFPWINAFRLADNYTTDFIGFSNFIVLPLSVIMTFMIVGVIEELMKLFSVKIADKGQIINIDDSIELFIVAALGFSFTENILYFYNIWMGQGPSAMMMPFLFRSAFSTFAHLIFSGILGYYYGIAHFAKPILQKEIRENRSLWTIALHRVLGIRKSKLFYQENLLEGLLISIGLHAIFNIFLELKLVFMIVPYVVFGYMALNYLLSKKENHKDYGYLLEGKRNH